MKIDVFGGICDFLVDVNCGIIELWKGDKNLEELRTSKGITATFVAKKLKISRDRLRRIENGEVYLPTEFIPILSTLYGVTNNKIIERRIKEWKK